MDTFRTNLYRSLPSIRPELTVLLRMAGGLREMSSEDLSEWLQTALSSPESEKTR